MKILAQTEYQDLYRISDGVLLVINKFIRIEYQNDKYFSIHRSDAKYKSYYKGCQKLLKELTEDYHDKYKNIVVPKGTVIYENYPVKPTNNKLGWTYEVKTTGSRLGGDFDSVENMLSMILRIMRTGQI